MIEEKKHIDLIEGYLQNKLSDSELKEFEELLIKDEDFGQLFIDMKTLVDGIRYSGSKTTLEEKLARLQGGETSIPKEGNEDQPGKKGVIIFFFNNIYKYKWAVAASFTFFVVAAIVLLNINTRPTNEALFDEYFTTFENGAGYAIVRGDSVTENIQNMAFYYYDLEEYTLASEYFGQVSSEEFNNVIILFYSGNALLAINQVNGAIDCFKQVIAIGNGLEIQAKWYLALCYLKLDDHEKMYSLLKEIVDSSTRYSEPAKDLLKKIM